MLGPLKPAPGFNGMGVMKMFPSQEQPFGLIICLPHLEARPNSTLSWLSAHVLQASVCGLSGDCTQSQGSPQNFLEVGFALSTAGGKEFAAAPTWLTFTDHKTILTLRAGEGKK